MVLSVGLSFCSTFHSMEIEEYLKRKGGKRKLVLTRFPPCFQKITCRDILDNPPLPHTNLHEDVHEVFLHPFSPSVESFKNNSLPECHYNCATSCNVWLSVGSWAENRKQKIFVILLFHKLRSSHHAMLPST